MIHSSVEFVRLRSSEVPGEQRRAATERAPEAVWVDVLERFPEMHRWVALNKTLPESILWKLVRDPDPDVRATVADRRQLTAPMLAALAEDREESVRGRVCYNAHTPREVLQQLTHDTSPYVSNDATRQLERRSRPPT